MRTGLALGSGGLRGAAHIGVLDELERAGVHIDMVAGTSAGSVVAAAYASGMSPKEMEERALAVSAKDVIDPIILSLLCLAAPAFLLLLGSKQCLPKGILKGRKLEDYIRHLVGPIRMSDLERPCAIVS
ncbi:MAG: patatin-like phospholipase family protein, partial [Firmicutes bacterium]|nr:patatin-like phospholipase family protein [Bacillota bacterium]